jgi:hypothetical protein
MKLIKPKPVPACYIDKDFPELIDCRFEHTVSKTEASLKYLGPQISPEVWGQILSFFSWTYQESHSESQVRLYVNPKLKEWRAWAFPQKSGTGMTAHELTLEELKRGTEETPEMTKARFAAWGVPASGDWIRFGSVHHHCGCSAFQSGTDETNEKSQDGLHITVGKIDEARHDLHCRFYINESCFDPDMSVFWDVGDFVREKIPDNLYDACARHQMTEPSDAEFPKEWKDNFMEVKWSPSQVSIPVTGVGTYYHGRDWRADWEPNGPSGVTKLSRKETKQQKRYWLRVGETISEMERDFIVMQMEDEEVVKTLDQLDVDPWKSIIKICVENGVSLEDVTQGFKAKLANRKFIADSKHNGKPVVTVAPEGHGPDCLCAECRAAKASAPADDQTGQFWGGME